MTTNMAERSRTAETGSAIRSDDIIAGNVSKYIVLPAAYCGQPKKGHLIFDACFESDGAVQTITRSGCTQKRRESGIRTVNIWELRGNLGRVDQVTEFEYDLFIRPDTCNPRFRVWFNFTVENVKESQETNGQVCLISYDGGICHSKCQKYFIDVINKISTVTILMSVM
ncbi:cytosolic carboxypeptidase 6-like protein [Turdus rufiventris]|nr:cytosolic carboxypeptidase 6-like protein [Turdus rufiventris]